MEFDVDGTINEMLLAVKVSVNNDLGEVGKITRMFLSANKARYKKLVEFRIEGKIDEANFKARLEDEKLMLEAQYNTLSIITKVMAQNAANAAFNVLESAVKTCLKII